jgi:CBS domain-containing protein
MELRDVMTPHVECIPPDATLQDAAFRMRSNDVGDVLVCDNDRLAGVVTDRDIVVRAIAEGKNPAKVRVCDIMSSGVVYCFEDQDVEEAARIMQEKQIRRLAILNRDKRLVGIVSLGDLALRTHDDYLAGKTLETVCEPVGAF